MDRSPPIRSSILLTIHQTTIYQIDSPSHPNRSHQEHQEDQEDIDPTDHQSLLLSSADLTLQVVDVSSAVSNSIPVDSQLPSYTPKSLNSDQSTPSSIETCLILSISNGLIEIPLSKSSQISCISPKTYLICFASDRPAEKYHVVSNEKLDNNHNKLKIVLSESLPDDQLELFDSILTSSTNYSGRLALHDDLSRFKSSNHHVNQTDSYHFTEKPNSNQQNLHDNPQSSEGRLALIDESTGEICGQLTSDIKVEAPSVGQPNPPPYPLISAPQPVMVSILPNTSSQNPGQSIAQVTPIIPQSQSAILSTADWVSRGIIAGSDAISSLIVKAGQSYPHTFKPATVPISFSPTTHSRTEKVLGYTKTATEISGKTIRVVGSVASKVGDRLGKATGIQRTPNGELPTGVRGYVHKGLLAFNTVLDSLESGGKKVLNTAGETTTGMVKHSYGPEAGKVAQTAHHSIRNVALVYIDARGVTRRAILKSVGKSAIRGTMTDGREVILGSDEYVESWAQFESKACQKNDVGPMQGLENGHNWTGGSNTFNSYDQTKPNHHNWAGGSKTYNVDDQTKSSDHDVNGYR
ncbi:hypothetical protein O181_028227 [Austropuccinia psidii MF-1]|uniref:Senescence domain-containing protein n=1 Tax=Austropuccinia psidii MF-1 TaxID=1389203 RepID=A0A9Q3CRG6_9BASI|nr:hypothetical protein [Austropuccinia psidii MF-1]